MFDAARLCDSGLTRRRKSVVQARSFAEMLEQKNATPSRMRSAAAEGKTDEELDHAVRAAQVIEELIGLAREMRDASARGDTLGLSDDELASTTRSASTIAPCRCWARRCVRGNVTIDWTPRENVRANLRRLLKRTLHRHRYPPDKQEAATRTVLEQAEVLSGGWAA